MTQFRKKPVVIDATQWFKPGDHAMVEPYDPVKAGAHIKGVGPYGWVKTLEGGHIVSPGDWIIRGVKGEHYPCKPEIFEATYESAGEATGATSFGQALQALKAGQRLTRTGWNGRGMFVYLVPAASYPVQTGAAKAHFGAGAMVPYNAYLAIKNVDETVSTWVPSVSDCLAEDWVIVGDVAATADLQGAYAAGKLAYESGVPSAPRPDYTDAEHDAWSRGWNDSAEASPASAVPPHQQRVLAEKMDRDQEISRLDTFICESPVFHTLLAVEQSRLRRQLDVMHELSAVLGERIANF